MKWISGGQTSVGADAKLLSSHAGDPRAATGDTTDTSHTGQHIPAGRQPVIESARRRPGTYRPDRTSPARSPEDADTETGYPKRPPGGGGHPVPSSRCVSAAGIRFSVIRFPPGSWALLAVGLPDLGPDLDGVTTFRTYELQPGWVPSLPRGRRCSSRPSRFLDRRLPLYRGQSLHPAPASHRAGLRLTRHQREFKQFTRPTVPLACSPRMEREPSGFPPGLRTPPTKSRRRTPRRGQAIEHEPGTTRSTSHSG